MVAFNQPTRSSFNDSRSGELQSSIGSFENATQQDSLRHNTLVVSQNTTSGRPLFQTLFFVQTVNFDKWKRFCIEVGAIVATAA